MCLGMGIVSFLLWLWFVYRCFIKNALAGAALSGVFGNYLLVFISLLGIEQGWWYSFELRQYTFENYATFCFGLFCIPVVLMATRFKFPVHKAASDTDPRIFVIMFSAWMLIILALIGLPEFGLQVKAGRFAELPKANVLNYIANIFLFTALYYLVTTRSRYVLLIAFMILANATLLNAVQTTIWYLVPPLLIRRAIRMEGKKLGFPFAYMLIAVFLVAIGFYVRSLSLSIGSVDIWDRLFSQGQLFWVSLNDSYQDSLKPVLMAFLRKFWSVENAPMNIEYGLGHYMVSVSPEVGARYVYGGTSFTAGAPGIWVFYSNFFIGWAFYILTAYLMLVYYRLYTAALARRELIESLLLSLIGSYVADVVIMGEYTRLNLRVVIYLCLYVSIRWFRKNPHFYRDRLLFQRAFAVGRGAGSR
jgi:hypothetical protein